MSGTSTSPAVAVHRDILRYAGIAAQNTVMYSTTCTCGDTCGVYTTPENTTWVHCRHCGFSGTSVEYVARSRRVKLEDMGAWLKDRGVAEDEIPKLMAAANHAPTLAFRALWKRARHNVSANHTLPEAFTLFQMKRVYTDWTRVPSGVGVLTVGDIAAIRSEHPFGQLKVSNAGSHKSFIAVARYDVPGRVCGINLIQSTGEADISSRDRLRNNFTGGLAIDELAADDLSPVYVFDEQHMALMFQAKISRGGSRPVRVAVYNYETSDDTWDCLRRAPVVYVAIDNIVDAISVVRKLPGAKIVRAKADTLEAWITGISTMLLPSLNPKERMDWTQAARSWLFEKPAIVKSQLQQLRLPAADTQRLLECCTAGERRALTADDLVYREVVFEGHTVRETPNGYAALLERSMVEIANVRVVLSHAIIEHSTSKTWYYGFLVFQGAHLPFAVEHTQLQTGKTFMAWLNSMTAAAGLGAPSVKPTWTGKLLALASKFATPTVENTDRLLGWSDESKALLLPAVTISPVSGVQDRASPINVGIPAGVWQASTDFTPLVTGTDARALEYMAFAVALATSMTAEAAGTDPYTFVIGVPPDMAARPATMAQELGIPVMIHHASKVVDRRYGAAPAIHGFPVLYQPEGGRVIGAVSRTATVRSEIIRAGYSAAGFSRLFPRTASIKFPISDTAAHTGHHNYAPQAARLACELTYRALKSGSAGDTTQMVVHEMAVLAREVGNEEHIHHMLGRLLLPPRTDAEWCARYVECAKQGIADGWLRPEVFRKRKTTEVVDASEVYREAMARGVPVPYPGAVVDRFCAAGLADQVHAGKH